MPEVIRVKALEWVEKRPAPDQIDARVFVTVGSLGGYSIHVRTNGLIHSFENNEWIGQAHDTLEDAKAACQADFARRVGECVEEGEEKDAAIAEAVHTIENLKGSLEVMRQAVARKDEDIEALQARCDKLEVARNQVIQELVEKALNDAAKVCQERYLPDERAKVLRYLSEWLKSQMEGE